MHYAIVGNIGSGKTTLTAKLAEHYSCGALFEAVEANPYLEDFYNDMKRWSFNLQVYFLTSRFNQYLNIRKTSALLIQDRTIYEDCYIFADSLHDMELMSTRDFENYKAIFDAIIHFIKPPDLLIYLQASVPTLLANIYKRGRSYEATIQTEYLKKLNDKYNNWITTYNLGKLLTINMDEINFEDRADDFDAVVRSVSEVAAND